MTPTLSRLLAHHARYRPDRVALVFAGREYSFAELNREVNRLANAWLDCGLVKGDKVATVLPNGFELMAAYWAAAVSGIVIVPCSTMLRPGGLKSLLRDSHSRLVIAHPDHAEALDSIRGDLKDIAPDRFVLTDFDAGGEKRARRRCRKRARRLPNLGPIHRRRRHHRPPEHRQRRRPV